MVSPPPTDEKLAPARDGVFLYRRGRYDRTRWLDAETYKFVFVPEGEYGVQVGDREERLAPGQFVVLNPHARHRHLGLRGTKLLVEVRPEAMREAAAALGRRRPPRFRQLRSSDGLVQAWAREWVADAEAGQALDADEIVAGLAVRLLELHDGPPRLRAAGAVARAVALINERFTERLTLDVLAAAAGMERFAFAHAFRRETGLAPHAYLRERRLAAAATALEKRGPILDVALASGFGSVSSFNRAFRAAFGVAPTRYRELCTRSLSRRTDARNAQTRDRTRPMVEAMRARCFLVYALAPQGVPAAEANRLLNEYVQDLSHGLPVYHDHFARRPHGGVAVIFPRDEQERAQLDDPGRLVGWQITVSPLVFSLTPVGFTAQTSFTLEQYGQTTLEQLTAEEGPSALFWWQRRSA